MFDSNGRVDIPRIMKGLSANSDLASQQNAAAALGYIACKSEEYRDAIAAQMEAIIGPLLAHLKSNQTDLVHNAAVLLGLCCSSGSEFRQAFGHQHNGIATLVKLLPCQDSGILCNVLFALRQYVGDQECPLSEELKASISQVLPQLQAHDNMRIQLNTQVIKTLLEQRPTVAAAPPAKQAPATTSLRRDESLQAVSALAQLATADKQENQELQQSNLLAWSIKLLEENSPTGPAGATDKIADTSPAKRRHSLLSPWKNRTVVPTAKTSPKRLKDRKVAYALTQVADG